MSIPLAVLLQLLLVLARKTQAAELERRRALAATRRAAERVERGGRLAAAARRRELEGLRVALDAHHPERTLARGYALVQDGRGEPVVSAREAGQARHVRVRFADGAVPATIHEEEQ